jgi:hypothetical protein
MSIGTPYSHCPRCWDHYDVCKCTDAEMHEYEENLKKEKNTNDAFKSGYSLGIKNGYTIAFQICKSRVLEILKQDLQNLDLSWDSCDKRYIEKIEKL